MRKSNLTEPTKLKYQKVVAKYLDQKGDFNFCYFRPRNVTGKGKDVGYKILSFFLLREIENNGCLFIAYKKKVFQIVDDKPNCRQKKRFLVYRVV